ncbi:hypothetical protein SDRG_03361 [Saprolegnia diclina VS20]|uniref:RBR-type E3 ubiquitin transferase n=1 Tax=Saprolegnia diclina (strain VS20) TaxID=1156394 RepID=T0QYK5_SAPDV|nr:hypothetical protein SDRG_03361 [Saprolegnia diclina VS20]EQC39155.1 hypothetical protein SDRG_03361 [Saprolegnia diclina VS20]|eukprot:XP_008607216.1 hypothetical protein SDRG_03361 [Saprolegnia diclina VS20]
MATAHADTICLICMDAIGHPSIFSRFMSRGVSGGSWELACKHRYHGNCLRAQLEAKVKHREAPITCCVVACKREIAPSDVASLVGSTLLAQFQSLLASKVAEAHRAFCPNKVCSRPYAVYAGMVKAQCSFCKVHFCHGCHALWHENLDCAAYQRILASGGDPDHTQFMTLKTAMGWKHCPACHAVIERNGGCNYVTCKCGRAFCYRCGAAYLSATPQPGNGHGHASCRCGLHQS